MPQRLGNNRYRHIFELRNSSKRVTSYIAGEWNFYFAEFTYLFETAIVSPKFVLHIDVLFCGVITFYNWQDKIIIRFAFTIFGKQCL